MHIDGCRMCSSVPAVRRARADPYSEDRCRRIAARSKEIGKGSSSGGTPSPTLFLSKRRQQRRVFRSQRRVFDLSIPQVSQIVGNDNEGEDGEVFI